MDSSEIQFQVKRCSARTVLCIWILILVGVVGFRRAFVEFVAFDSVSDIFYDVRESDKARGYELLYGRWLSFHPILYPDAEATRYGRTLSGCCLVVAFWDQLSEADQENIAREALPRNIDSENERKLKQLVQCKVQIEAASYESLSDEQRKLWNEESSYYGNVSEMEQSSRKIGPSSGKWKAQFN